MDTEPNTVERVVTYSCLAAFVIAFWVIIAAWFGLLG